MDHLTELEHRKKVSLLFQIIIRSRNSGKVKCVKYFGPLCIFIIWKVFIVEISGWIQTDMPEPGWVQGQIFGR